MAKELCNDCDLGVTAYDRYEEGGREFCSMCDRDVTGREVGDAVSGAPLKVFTSGLLTIPQVGELFARAEESMEYDATEDGKLADSNVYSVTEYLTFANEEVLENA